MNAEKIIRDLPKALINWYNFKEGAKALFISGGRPECEVLFDVLKERNLKISVLSVAQLEEAGAFDPGSGESGVFDPESREAGASDPESGEVDGFDLEAEAAGTFVSGSGAAGVPASGSEGFRDFLGENGTLDTNSRDIKLNGDDQRGRDYTGKNVIHVIQFGGFDYIVAAGIIERSKRPEEILTKLRHLLKPAGKLLIGAENRLGLRYFCGDKDEFSGHVLDGIDGYKKVSDQRKKVIGGQAYSKAEYEAMFQKAGFQKRKFYSVLPLLVRPQLLISEDYTPNEALDVRVFPQYKSPGTIYLEEEQLYAELMENHMFHPMANAFFIECSIDSPLLDVDQITVQGDREREEALATMVKGLKWVYKKALYPEGQHKIDEMFQHMMYLREHKVPVAEGRLEGGTYAMPYIHGQMATAYFRETLRRDSQEFIRELEGFRKIILNSSQQVPYEKIDWRRFEPGWERRKKDDPNIDEWEKRAFGSEEEKQEIGVILKRGYIDMVSINCFHTKSGFVFFDQEFFIENFPVNAIFIRTIDFIYRDSPDLEMIYPREEVLKHFHLSRHQRIWRKLGNEFLEKLRNDKILAEYNRMNRRDGKTVVSNRHRMDYSQEEYEKLFTDIFKGLGSKKIYLFGSGRYAEQFLEQFKVYYDIAGILDNNSSRWGECIDGIEIYPPSVLNSVDVPFKVFICIKFFDQVLGQLMSMGIRDISVYDPRLEYDRPLKATDLPKGDKPKKYHIGYVAGVFDLFHIGHLNLLRRAKEQCDYLIAGVVSDEQVIRGKKTRPYIPFDERLAIVEACRYVDEAVKIPEDRPNTEDAYHMYHFDVQFSGSDYEKDPDWLARKVFLRQHGADMVFFPYTETTSSTEIKEQIRGEDGT